jgi:hypothetical protein
MTYLPWAGSLQSDSAADPMGPSSAADPLGSNGSHGSAPHRTSAPQGVAAENHAVDPGVCGEAISNRLFSAGLDLHFVLMMVHDGPGRRRLEHAVAELDDAIKDLRHLMLAVTQRLA